MADRFRVTINNFEEALRYVAGRGFTCKPGLPGWIIEAQYRMCNAVAALEKAAGGYPFAVVYHRRPASWWGWGRFVVKGRHGIVLVTEKEALGK